MIRNGAGGFRHLAQLLVDDDAIISSGRVSALRIAGCTKA